MSVFVCACENDRAKRPDTKRCYANCGHEESNTHRISIIVYISVCKSGTRHDTTKSFDTIDSKRNLSIDGVRFISLYDSYK